MPQVFDSFPKLNVSVFHDKFHVVFRSSRLMCGIYQLVKRPQIVQNHILTSEFIFA